MNPVSEDIKNKLAEKDVGDFASVGNWGIFVSAEPDSPNNCITVYDTPGRISKAYNTNRHGYFSGFQLRIRGNSYLESRKKAQECIDALDRIGKFVVDDVAYDNVFITDEPYPLQKDEKERSIWIVNGIAARQETA